MQNNKKIIIKNPTYYAFFFLTCYSKQTFFLFGLWTTRQKKKVFVVNHFTSFPSRNLICGWGISIYRPRQVKRCLQARAIYMDSSRTCAKFHPGTCSPLIYSVVSNDSFSGREGSDRTTRMCMLEDTF